MPDRNQNQNRKTKNIPAGGFSNLPIELRGEDEKDKKESEREKNYKNEFQQRTLSAKKNLKDKNKKTETAPGLEQGVKFFSKRFPLFAAFFLIKDLLTGKEIEWNLTNILLFLGIMFSLLIFSMLFILLIIIILALYQSILETLKIVIGSSSSFLGILGDLWNFVFNF